MLQMAQAVGAPMLLVASSTHPASAADQAAIARDLRKLAMLAVPLGLKSGLRRHWRRQGGARLLRQPGTRSDRADVPNLGLAIDTAHTLLAGTPLDDLDLIDPDKIFVVRLADVFDAEGHATVDARPHGAASGSSPARACTAIRSPPSCCGWPIWVFAATTASRSSTTTTASCRRDWCRSAPVSRRSGWARTCCAARSLCPDRCA